MKKILSLGLKENFDFSQKQSCVVAVRKSDLPDYLKREADFFVKRNVLPDCGRVSPNCFKAFLIDKAKKFGLNKEIFEKIRGLFKSKVGYGGYYLDSGVLRRVKFF